MAYRQLTSVSNIADLISNILTFAGENGWTVRRNSAASGLRQAAIHIPNTSDNIHIYNDSLQELSMRLSIGYDSALPPGGQPNVSAYESRSDLVGPFPNVYLFANGNAIHVVVQVADAIEFRHLCFGVLNKAGVYTGGTYAEGSWRNQNYRGDIGQTSHAPFIGNDGNFTPGAPYAGSLRVDVPGDQYLNNFAPFLDSSSKANTLYTGVSTFETTGVDQAFAGRVYEGTDTNAFSGRSIIHPIRVFFVRKTNLRKAFVGQVVGTFAVAMVKFTHAQEITIGSDVYKLFPVFKRNLRQERGFNSPDFGSHTLGYAIRKTP